MCVCAAQTTCDGGAGKDGEGVYRGAREPSLFRSFSFASISINIFTSLHFTSLRSTSLRFTSSLQLQTYTYTYTSFHYSHTNTISNHITPSYPPTTPTNYTPHNVSLNILHHHLLPPQLRPRRLQRPGLQQRLRRRIFLARGTSRFRTRGIQQGTRR